MECVARVVNSRRCKASRRLLDRRRLAGETVAGNPILLANYSQLHYLPAMRLALKTGSYSLMHLTVAIAVTYAITQDWRAALAVGLIEPAVQTIAFLIHDRLWSRIEAHRDTA
jgi:uncharacterized membrane protein